MTRRLKIIVSLLVGAVLIGIAVILALSQKSPTSRPVLDTDLRDQSVYQWAFGYDDATLGIRADATGIMAISLDRSTRTPIPLPALAKALTALRPSVRVGNHRALADLSNALFFPSPDNRWVLMPDAAHGTSARRVYAVRANGKQVVSMTRASPDSQIAWLSDSRRWEEVTQSAYMLHDVTAPHTLTRLPVKALATPQASATTLYGPAKPNTGILLLPTGGWVTTDWSPDNSGSGKPAVFWRATVEQDAVIIRPVGIVTPPKDMDNVQIELSPKGDQVAWIGYRTPPHAPAAVIKLLARVPPVQRLLAPLVSPPDQSVVWVTRLDGSDMRQISAEPCIGGQVPAYNPYDWSTDGNRFLFTETKSGKRYAVPVP